MAYIHSEGKHWVLEPAVRGHAPCFYVLSLRHFSALNCFCKSRRAAPSLQRLCSWCRTGGMSWKWGETVTTSGDQPNPAFPRNPTE